MGDVCIDKTQNFYHCGACNNRCKDDERCTNSKCVKKVQCVQKGFQCSSTAQCCNGLTCDVFCKDSSEPSD
jgi:hypothetical protein